MAKIMLSIEAVDAEDLRQALSGILAEQPVRIDVSALSEIIAAAPVMTGPRITPAMVDDNVIDEGQAVVDQINSEETNDAGEPQRRRRRTRAEIEAARAAEASASSGTATAETAPGAASAATSTTEGEEPISRETVSAKLRELLQLLPARGKNAFHARDVLRNATGEDSVATLNPDQFPKALAALQAAIDSPV